MLLCSSQVFAVSYFRMNSEHWDGFPRFQKFLYLTGVFDGLLFTKNNVIYDVKINTEVSEQQYVDAIDVLYSDYKNALIPVPFLLAVISLELSGASEEEVEALLQRLRKTWASSPAE